MNKINTKFALVFIVTSMLALRAEDDIGQKWSDLSIKVEKECEEKHDKSFCRHRKIYNGIASFGRMNENISLDTNGSCDKAEDKSLCEKIKKRNRGKTLEPWDIYPVVLDGKGFVRIKGSSSYHPTYRRILRQRYFIIKGEVNLEDLIVEVNGLNGANVTNLRQDWQGPMGGYMGYLEFDYNIDEKKKKDPKIRIKVGFDKAEGYYAQFSTVEFGIPFNPYLDTIEYLPQK